MLDKHLPHHHGNTETIENLSEQLSQLSDFVSVAEIFKLLGDSSRMRIYWLLCHCEECVINISAAVSMSSPAVSHHLMKLKSSGLIVSRREGKEVYYKSADTEAAAMLHDIIEKIMEITCPK